MVAAYSIFALLVASSGIDPPALEMSLAPNLSADRGALLATWIERASKDGEASRHRVCFARFDGRTWSAPSTIIESDELFANWADVPSVTAANDGTLLAHWLQKSGAGTYAYDVQLARSRDGKTWSALGALNDDRTPTEHGFVSVLPEGPGGFRAFWLDGRNMASSEKAPMTLRTARILEKATAGEVLDERVCDCCGTSAVVTPSGAAIIYRDRDEQEQRDISVVRGTERRWSKPQLVHADGWKIEGCPVNGPAADRVKNSIAVAWFTAGRGARVEVAFSRDGGKSFGAPIRADEDVHGETLGRVDLVLEDESNAIVSWLSGESEKTARIYARRIHADGSRGAPRVLAETSPARASGFPKLALLDRELVFAWTEVGPPSRVRMSRVSANAIPARAPESRVRREVERGPIAYEATTLDGRAASLAQLRGRPVLLNVWATWCAPCRKELPELARLHERHAKQGLSIVAASVDEAGGRERVRALVDEARVPYEVWLDPEDRASRAFGVGALPATLLFDRTGALVWKHLGVLRPDDPELSEKLAAVMAKPKL